MYAFIQQTNYAASAMLLRVVDYVERQVGRGPQGFLSSGPLIRAVTARQAAATYLIDPNSGFILGLRQGGPAIDRVRQKR